VPADLLPADWPGDLLARALERAFRAFHPLIGGYLADLAG
jgi:hypothetical protein